jgi:hypothetical protein
MDKTGWESCADVPFLIVCVVHSVYATRKFVTIRRLSAPTVPVMSTPFFVLDELCIADCVFRWKRYSRPERMPSVCHVYISMANTSLGNTLLQTQKEHVIVAIVIMKIS